jgi:hypothetical protein
MFDRSVNYADITVNITDRSVNCTDITVNMFDRSVNYADITVNITDSSIGNDYSSYKGILILFKTKNPATD